MATLAVTHTVIATGGSAVYGKEGMENLKKLGPVLYLDIGFDTLTARLGDYQNRGVVLREGMTLRDLYEERTALYRQYADATVDEEALAGGLTETTEQALSLAHKLLQL